MPLKKLFDPGYEAAREREALRAARIARQTQRGEVLAQSLGKAGAGAISGWSAGEQAEKKSKAAEAEKAWKLSEMQRTRARQDAADLRAGKGETRSAVSHHLKTNMAAYAAMPEGQRADAMVADVKQLGMNMDPRAAQALISKFESEQAAKGVARESADLTLQKKQHELDSLYYNVTPGERKILDAVKMHRGQLSSALRNKLTEILEKYGASSALSPGIQGQVDAATGTKDSTEKTSPVEAALGPRAPLGGTPRFDLPPAKDIGSAMGAKDDVVSQAMETAKRMEGFTKPSSRKTTPLSADYGTIAATPHTDMIQRRAPVPTQGEPLPEGDYSPGDELSPILQRMSEIDPGVGEYIARKPKEEAEVIEQLLRDGGSAVSDDNAVIFRDAAGTVVGIEKIDPDAPSSHVSSPDEEMPQGDFDPEFRLRPSDEVDFDLRRHLKGLKGN